MAASPTPIPASESDGRHPAIVDAARRVVSVSPHDRHDLDGLDRTPVLPMASSSYSSRDRLAGESREMLEQSIDRARAAGRDLHDVAASLRAEQDAAGERTTRLQERLQLGARMLKALDGQIARAEQTAERLERFEAQDQRSRDRLDAMLEAGLAALSRAAEAHARRMTELLETGLSRLREATMQGLRDVTLSAARGSQRGDEQSESSATPEAGTEGDGRFEPNMPAIDVLVNRLVAEIRAGMQQEFIELKQRHEERHGPRLATTGRLSLHAPREDEDDASGERALEIDIPAEEAHHANRPPRLEPPARRAAHWG